MATTALKPVYMMNGKVFETAAEAREFERLPQVVAALNLLVGGNSEFQQFLLTNKDEILKAFEAGVIARVTKAEKNKLSKALDALKLVSDSKLRFLQENADAILESFRWPAVKRLKPEEKAAETMTALTALADEKAALWLVANREALERAYEAGVEKRPAPTGGGLEEYLAAKKAGPEALAAYQERKAKAKAEAKAAADAAKA